MPTLAASDLPPDTTTFVGPKGALFYLNSKGNRVYIVNSKSDVNRSFLHSSQIEGLRQARLKSPNPKRGAFLRFIENNAGILS